MKEALDLRFTAPLGLVLYEPLILRHIQSIVLGIIIRELKSVFSSYRASIIVFR